MDPRLSSAYFESLYTKGADEEVIQLSDAPGITIIKPYSRADRKDYKMFIRFYILEDGYVHGGVNMIEKSTSYIRENKETPNFSLDVSDKITYDADSQRFIIKRWFRKTQYSVNDFVKLLIKNHLLGKTLKDKLIAKISIYFLSMIFWLLDNKYNPIDYWESMENTSQNPRVINNSIAVLSVPTPDDPFFKYFCIYRRILFISILILTTVFFVLFHLYIFGHQKSQNWWSIFDKDYFGIDNPLLFFGFFAMLISLEYLSSFLRNRVNNKNGFIYKVHSSLFFGKFTLRRL